MSFFHAWWSSSDQIGFILSRPIVQTPGSRFNYNTAAVHLLSVALSVKVGGTAPFADSVLFSPLGIYARAWERDSRGFPNGGAGLSLRPRDMAKIGALVLQRGISGRDTIISPAWIDESTRDRLGTGESLTGLGNLDYGDLWWLANAGGHRMILAWGYGGQLIAVFPDLDLVLVTTSRWNDGPAVSFERVQTIMRIVAGQLLGTVRPD